MRWRPSGGILSKYIIEVTQKEINHPFSRMHMEVISADNSEKACEIGWKWATDNELPLDKVTVRAHLVEGY